MNQKKIKLNKHESLTKAIRNAGKLLNMNIMIINEISGILSLVFQSAQRLIYYPLGTRLKRTT